ncbi:MAG: family 43 glycosylhydrolase [Pontiella sp.]
MKRTTQVLFSVLIGVAGSVQAAPRRSNPIVSHRFTADASAHVWNDGRLYVYPSSDTSPPSSYRTMDGYHVFSTDDMITWVDHGEILHSRDVEWGTKRGGSMWAPDCAYKNGTYYFVFPHKNVEGIWELGVATSKSPASDFKLQGTIKGGNTFCDPCIFIDHDGQAYLYAVVKAKCYAAKLKDNMMEIEGEMVHQQGVDEHREGPFVFKRKGTYYMIYPDHHKGFNEMQYSMSDSPLGPWEPKGVFVEHTDVITMHGSIVEYKGQWYLFYHNGSLSGGHATNRSICFDRVFFNEDGTLQMVKQTLGVKLPTFHQDINYNRMFGTLDIGTYTTADLEKYGIQNDAISSLELPSGTMVECFEEDNGKGKSWRFEESFIDLGKLGCDNTFSSIKVSRNPNVNLVPNGSFEKGVEQTIANWRFARRGLRGISRNLGSADHGYYALCFEGNWAMLPVTQTVAVESDATYKVSVSLKIDPDSIGQIVFSAGEHSFELDAAEKAGEWVRFSETFNSGKQNSISISCSTSKDFKGTCCWDGVAMIEQK